MFNKTKSKKTLLTQSSFPNIPDRRSSRHGQRKHSQTHEFDVLFTKINNIREWTKNLIKNAMAVISLETDMNIDGYLEDSEKKHLGKTRLEVLGIAMINAAKGSGIKGGIYEKALIKVGECERRLGTYNKDHIVDVCSSFIRPLKYFLDVELNKLSEEKEMLTSRKIDYDYHVKQMVSGKLDKNGLHKLKMAEMALEFQYIHAKEVLHEIEASECQVGHLSDLINVQAVYHQKCLAELDKLRIDLKKISSNTESDKKAPTLPTLNGKSTSTVHKRRVFEGGIAESISSTDRRVLSNSDKLKSSHWTKKSEPCTYNQTEQCGDVIPSRPAEMQLADKRISPPNTQYPQKDPLRCTMQTSHKEDKTQPTENLTDTSRKDLLNEQPKKECCNKGRTSGKTHTSQDNYVKPHCKSSCHHGKDLTSGNPAPDGFTTDGSNTSKETHIIPLPLRSDYRRDVGKIYFTPRQDLE